MGDHEDLSFEHCRGHCKISNKVITTASWDTTPVRKRNRSPFACEIPNPNKRRDAGVKEVWHGAVRCWISHKMVDETMSVSDDGHFESEDTDQGRDELNMASRRTTESTDVHGCDHYFDDRTIEADSCDLIDSACASGLGLEGNSPRCSLINLRGMPFLGTAKSGFTTNSTVSERRQQCPVRIELRPSSNAQEWAANEGLGSGSCSVQVAVKMSVNQAMMHLEDGLNGMVICMGEPKHFQ